MGPERHKIGEKRYLGAEERNPVTEFRPALRKCQAMRPNHPAKCPTIATSGFRYSAAPNPPTGRKNATGGILMPRNDKQTAAGRDARGQKTVREAMDRLAWPLTVQGIVVPAETRA